MKNIAIFLVYQPGRSVCLVKGSLVWIGHQPVHGSMTNCMECFSSRIGDNLEQSLPSLTELVLTNNNIQELVSVISSHQKPFHDQTDLLAWNNWWFSILKQLFRSVRLLYVFFISNLSFWKIYLLINLVSNAGWPGPPGLSEDADPPQVEITCCHIMLNPALVCFLTEWLNLQFVKESSDQQEALQALCHQQNPTDPCARLPEGKAKGKCRGARMVCTLYDPAFKVMEAKTGEFIFPF